MNPAFSVVFLTTLIGAGQGLFVALFLAELTGFGASDMGEQKMLAIGGGVALMLCALGLLASVFHLGRPERAWRAAAMWRTSWLSREVIALPAFMALLFFWSLAHWAGSGASVWLGWLGVVACLTLFVCTGMVYASIRFLQEWASAFTLVNYTLLGLASGFVLATALAAYAAPEWAGNYGLLAFVFTVAGGISRGLSLQRNARLKPKSTLQSAIGIRHPKIAQRSMGFMGGSFNTREFFHGRPREVVRAYRLALLWLLQPVPALLLLVGGASATVLLAALLLHYAGVLAERWYFFAEARHPQNTYYQAIA
jgi:DMSO reductase anchor subunit